MAIGYFTEWANFYPKTILGLHDNILTANLSRPDSQAYHDVQLRIIDFCIACTLSGCQDIGSRVLSEFLRIDDLQFRESDKTVLELFWRHVSPRPEHAPWQRWTDEQIYEHTKKNDTESVEFWESWTHTDWMREMYGAEIGDDYDMHQWKDTTNPLTHAICARLLCRPENGSLPSSKRFEEALEAVNKLFAQLPPREERRAEYSGYFSLRIYLLLALRVGKLEKALEIFDEVFREIATDPYELCFTPAFHIFLSKIRDIGHIRKPVMSIERCKHAERILIQAIEQRVEKKRQEPLQGLPWPELLRRFSEVAFKQNREEYEENGINSAAEILNPPATLDHIREIETTVGELPQDLKEMVLVADGFKGGWHFAAGGFPGISSFEVEPAANHGAFIGIKPDVERNVTTEVGEDGIERTITTNTISIPLVNPEGDWGSVLSVYLDDSDGFTHVLCPPEVWTRIRNGRVKDGEYRYFAYSYWGSDHKWCSFRHWVASETVDLEREAELQDESKFPL